MRKKKVFLLPYAGGSAYIYSKWAEKKEDDTIQFIPLELKGRGVRKDEPFYNSVKEAVKDIRALIELQIKDHEYAVFGHSMGSWLAYELYYEMVESGLPAPVHLFLSGRRAPWFMKNEATLHDKPDDIIINEIDKIGGLPKEFSERKSLWEIFLPLLRSDFAIVEKYMHHEKKQKINCGITLMSGAKDSITSVKELEAWREGSNGEFSLYFFQGGHFYIREEAPSIMNIIRHKMMADQ